MIDDTAVSFLPKVRARVYINQGPMGRDFRLGLSSLTLVLRPFRSGPSASP